MSAITSNIQQFSFPRKLDETKTPKISVWEELLPVITTIALGSFFSPVFRFGTVIGALDVIVKGSALAILGVFNAAVSERKPAIPQIPKKTI